MSCKSWTKITLSDLLHPFSLCKPAYSEHASNFVRFYKSRLTCVLLTAICVAIKIDIKHSALILSEKAKIINKADSQSHVMHTEVIEQLSDLPAVNNTRIVMIKTNVLQQCITYSAR